MQQCVLVRPVTQVHHSFVAIVSSNQLRRHLSQNVSVIMNVPITLLASIIVVHPSVDLPIAVLMRNV